MEVPDAPRLAARRPALSAEQISQRLLLRQQETADVAADAQQEWADIAAVPAAAHIRREPEDILFAQRASEQAQSLMPGYRRLMREHFAAPPASVAHARRAVHREGAHRTAQDEWSEEMQQQQQQQQRAPAPLTFEWPTRLLDLPHELLTEPLRFVPRYLRDPFEQHDLGRELLLHMQPALSWQERATGTGDVWHPLGVFKRQMRRAGLALAADVAREREYYTLEGRFLVPDSQLKREDEFTDAEQMWRLRDDNQEVPDTQSAACDPRYREQRLAEDFDARATERTLRAMDTSRESRYFRSYLEDQTRVYTILQPHRHNTPLAQPTWKLLELGSAPPQPNLYRLVGWFVTVN